MKQIILFLFALMFIGNTVLAQTLDKYDVFEKKKFETKVGTKLPYRILYPKNFDKSQTYPLVLFLHGSGERGDDNEKQLAYIGDRLLHEREHGFEEAIYIIPQCPETDMWIDSLHRADLKEFKNLYVENAYAPSKTMLALEELMEQMLAESFVDTNNVAVTGLSMGGFGTLDILERHPKWFTRAAVICGGGNIANSKRYARNTAIRLYHGGADSVVNPDLSRALYDRLRVEGISVNYTEYPGVDHNAWDYALKESTYIEWLITSSGW